MSPDAPPPAGYASGRAIYPGASIPWIHVFWFSVGAAVLGGVSSLQLYYLAAALDRPVSACDALYWGMRGWFEWLVLLPAILGLCRRWTVSRQSGLRVWSLHISALLAFPILHALLSALVSVVYHWISGWEIAYATSVEPAFGRRLQFNFAIYLGIVIGCHAYFYAKRLRERDAQVQALAHSLTEARLQALQAQLNPHFLFNTLNTVSSLYFTHPDAANRILGKLGHVLRFSLEAAKQAEVTLDAELVFLRHYLEIEQMRFGDRLTFEIDAPEDTRSILVPTLLLHPLVENAVRYATRQRTRPAVVRVHCRREENALLLKVSDSGPGFAANWQVNPEQTGIGLNTTTERINLIPGATLEIGASPDGGAEVRLCLPTHAGAREKPMEIPV